MLFSCFVSIARLRTFALLFILVGLTFGGSPESPNEIVWERSFSGAMANAKTESKILFLAVNMDSEIGNDRTVQGVYPDATVAALTRKTINLVASVGQHLANGDCPRLGAVTCEEHKAIDKQARKRILKPDASGHVVAPQHVWLDPSGKVLLSVPYEITVDEMQWCFHEAQRLLDPKNASSVPTKGKRPSRAIVAGVEGTKRAAESLTALTPEEVEKLVREVRKATLPWDQLYRNYERLRLSPHPEARKVIGKYLDQMAPVPGGGSAMIRSIGAESPTAYWEVLVPFISCADKKVRNEVAVALEQIAAPEALKPLAKQYKKEKDPQIRKNLLRAIAASGPADRTAQSLLLKAAKQSKDHLLRRNALIGLGLHEANKDVRGALQKALKSGSEMDRFAAVIAMGLSRDEHWNLALSEVIMPSAMGVGPKKSKKNKKTKRGKKGQKSGPTTPSMPLKELAQTALIVQTTGDFKLLGAAVTEACADKIPRKRGQ